MKEFSDMGHEELMLALERFVNDQFTVLRFKREVVKRIRNNRPLTEADVNAINEFIAKEREIDRKDLGSLHEPQWLKDLGARCAELRSQLISSMATEQGATV